MNKNKEKKIKEEELLTSLTEWFDSIDLTKRNAWQRNKVAALIKNRIQLIGKWQRKRRNVLAERLRQKLEQDRIEKERLAREAEEKAKNDW